MTITSFDNGMPDTFYREKTFEGRLAIFMAHAVQTALKKNMIRKDLDKISFIVTGKEDLEVLFEGHMIGKIRLIAMTKDFIFREL